MAGFEVAGRKFRTEADYKAALRDKAKIDEIRKQVNMEQPGEVITLYAKMQTGSFRFETAVGNDFDDEIFELAQEFKKQGYNQNSKIDLRKKGKRGVKNKSDRRPKKSDTSVAAAKKNGEAEVSLDHYDKAMQKEILSELKKRERRRKIIVVLCGITAVSCFGYFGVYSYFAERTEMDYESLSQLKGSSNLTSYAPTQRPMIHRTQEENIELTVLEEYQTLYNKNKKMVGWIKIEDTEIDYPVMQSSREDPEYYLRRDYRGNYDINGSLFLQADCILGESKNLTIYGHNMNSGAMFGNLDRYASYDYWKAHPRVFFQTPEGMEEYRIAAVLKADVSMFDFQRTSFRSVQELEAYTAQAKALSLFETGITGAGCETTLTLVTCSYEWKEARNILVAVKTEPER